MTKENHGGLEIEEHDQMEIQKYRKNMRMEWKRVLDKTTHLVY